MSMTYTEQNRFQVTFPFNTSPRELAIATGAAVGIVFLAMVGIGMGTGADEVTAAPVKADRLAIGGEQACAGQAWGNWSEACLKALTEKQNVSLVPSRTVEFRDAGRQLSVLTSEPSNS